MCGIFGIITKPQKQINDFSLETMNTKLFRLAESRGKEAAGLAWITQKNIHILKKAYQASELITSTVYLNLWKRYEKNTRATLGHSRLATNGMLQDNHNNQPTFGSHTVVIHNGIVVNDEALWKTNKKLERKHQVDTEVIVKLFELGLAKTKDGIKALQYAVNELKGAVSIALASTRLDSIILYTNTGSLYYTHNNDNDIFVFTSESHSLNMFLQAFDLNATINRLEPNEFLTVDLKSVIVKRGKLKTRPSNIFPARHTPWGKIHDLSSYPKPKTILITNHAQKQFSKKIQKHYSRNWNAISKIKRCTRCILPETMPLIHFNKQGICNYCLNFNPLPLKSNIGDILNKYPTNSQFADCIVPFSGGRDSSYGLHYIKNILKMKPIAYTYDWGMVTDLARRNQSRIVSQLGVEHIVVSADIAKKRRNIRLNVLAWLKKPDIGIVPLFMAGDKQAEYYAMELKKRTGISLVIYSRGNQLENEEFKWGHCGIRDGSPEGVLHNLASTGKLKLAIYYWKNFLKNTSYLNVSLFDTAFAYFVAYLMPLDFVYLYHYVDWREETVVNTLIDEYDWEVSEDTKATWRIDDGTVPFYNYIYYAIQGFSENDTFRSNQIRSGHLTRQAALKYVDIENQPRIPGLLWYFNQLNIDPIKAVNTIESVKKLYPLE